MAVEFYIHKMSEHMESAEIIKWRVKEGDYVEKNQIIVEVMTDKVAAEVESPAEGVVKGIRPGAIEGAVVPIGKTLCYIASSDEEVPSLPPLVSEPRSELSEGEKPTGVQSIGNARESKPIGQEETTPFAGVRSSPVARKLANSLGIDINQIVGTGPRGRVTENDVRLFADTTSGLVSRPAL